MPLFLLKVYWHFIYLCRQKCHRNLFMYPNNRCLPPNVKCKTGCVCRNTTLFTVHKATFQQNITFLHHSLGVQIIHRPWQHCKVQMFIVAIRNTLDIFWGLTPLVTSLVPMLININIGPFSASKWHVCWTKLRLKFVPGRTNAWILLMWSSTPWHIESLNRHTFNPRETYHKKKH